MLPFTLQQLQILKTIATEENLTRASEQLYLSQPSVSKQIQRLEKNLDMLLINRETNKISLTENGKVLLKYSERILTLCEESCKALIDLKNLERGHLTIGVSQTVGIYLLTRAISLFAQNYPQIDLKIQINSTRLITKNVINRETDLAIVGGEIPDELRKNLRVEPFMEDEFSLVIPKSHPFATKKTIFKKDLYNLNFITLNSNSTLRKFMNNRLSQNQIDPKKLKIIMELNSMEEIKVAVSLGLGATFGFSSAIEKEIKLKTIKILKIENIRIYKRLTIISNYKHPKSKAFEFFYSQLLGLKQLPNPFYFQKSKIISTNNL